MAIENAGAFESILRKDKAMQARLKELDDAYDGDKSDEESYFEAVIAPLAEEVGLPFTFEEHRRYVSADRKLDDEELGDLASGGAICYVLGDDKSEPEPTPGGADPCSSIGVCD